MQSEQNHAMYVTSQLDKVKPATSGLRSGGWIVAGLQLALWSLLVKRSWFCHRQQNILQYLKCKEKGPENKSSLKSGFLKQWHVVY